MINKSKSHEAHTQNVRKGMGTFYGATVNQPTATLKHSYLTGSKANDKPTFGKQKMRLC
jgi:hypothetical protein